MWRGPVNQMAEGRKEEETRNDVCPIAEKRKERTCMDALRVVLHEQDSKRMKRTREIEEEVSGVE